MQFDFELNSITRATMADGNDIQNSFNYMASARDEQILSATNKMSSIADDVITTVKTNSADNWDNNKVKGFSAFQYIDANGNKYEITGAPMNDKKAELVFGEKLRVAQEGRDFMYIYADAAVNDVSSYFKNYNKYGNIADNIYLGAISNHNRPSFVYAGRLSSRATKDLAVDAEETAEDKNCNSILFDACPDNKQRTVFDNSIAFVGNGTDTEQIYNTYKSLSLGKTNGNVVYDSIGIKGKGSSDFQSILLQNSSDTHSCNYYSVSLYSQNGTNVYSGLSIGLSGYARNGGIGLIAYNSNHYICAGASSISIGAHRGTIGSNHYTNECSITLFGDGCQNKSISILGAGGSIETSTSGTFMLHEHGKISTCYDSISIKGSSTKLLSQSYSSVVINRDDTISNITKSFILNCNDTISNCTGTFVMNNYIAISNIKNSFIQDSTNLDKSRNYPSVNNLNNSFIFMPRGAVSYMDNSFLFNPQAGAARSIVSGCMLFNAAKPKDASNDIFGFCLNTNPIWCKGAFFVGENDFRAQGKGTNCISMYGSKFGSPSGISIMNSSNFYDKTIAMINSKIELEAYETEGFQSRSIGIIEADVYHYDTISMFCDFKNPLKYSESHPEYFSRCLHLWDNGFIVNAHGFVNNIKMQKVSQLPKASSIVSTLLKHGGMDNNLRINSYLAATDGLYLYMIKEK